MLLEKNTVKKRQVNNPFTRKAQFCVLIEKILILITFEMDTSLK